VSLAHILAHPAIWRGGDCAPEPEALPTGHAALDAVLPGGGWPQGALTEILLAREGIGELRLALPALAALTAAGRSVVWIAPPYRPYAPALAAAHVDLSRFIVVRCHGREALWAYEQALRARDCGAAFAWLDVREPRALRRLQVAAREGRTLGVLWRRPGRHAIAAQAPLRLALDAHDGQLAVRVLKRRGPELAQPVMLDLAHASGTPFLAAAGERRASSAAHDARPGSDRLSTADPRRALMPRSGPHTERRTA
jgi:cell division inhibitor SulA/protein ImuA